ncbi:hypothetical protein N7495_008968 [Penicillium taxi]|uniref:uncharacterized protein n=1 Tax=Penicillium taxi TaxID=168475 RepID=UPI002545B584|nr:uncharacterized protein N7495_008968 [Penicillium taxi]KAJ5888927.1 hypothetical protein N7495_008968 [Penicillium taxi]
MDDKLMPSIEADAGPSNAREDSLNEDQERLQASSSDDLDSDSDCETSLLARLTLTRRSTRLYNIPHIEENGRGYCDTSYYMPNDEPELTRLNIMHQIYLILQGGHLTLAPLSMPSPRILDIGTGPGDWAIEMSAEYPNAKIIASDIGVFDSGLAHVSLPNVEFQLVNASSPWTYDEPFDLIHIRGLSGAFKDWSAIYKEAFAHLKPGGYIQIADADPAADIISYTDIKTDSYLHVYAQNLLSAANEAGYPRDQNHLETDTLAEAGFVDIKVTERTVPIGLWPNDIHEKTLGKMALIALLEGLEAHALRPLTSCGWSAEKVQELCENVKMEVLGVDQLTASLLIVMGRKPAPPMSKRDELMARAMQRARRFHLENEGVGRAEE